MKTIKQQSAKVLVAFMLLMTFVVGQLIVIAHTHKEVYAKHQSQSKKSDADDKCKICAQNHHAQLFLQQHHDLFSVAVSKVKVYLYYQDSYHSVRTLQSCNRGPPVS